MGSIKYYLAHITPVHWAALVKIMFIKIIKGWGNA